MMVLDSDIVILIAVTIITLGGATIGSKWVKYRYAGANLDAETVKKTIALKNKYIGDLEKEVDEYEKLARSWKGKYNQLKQGPKVDIESVPTNLEGAGLDSIINDNLPLIANQLPKEIGTLLLQNKDKVASFVKEHPEIIQKFISGKSKEGQPETGIPQFDGKNAV